MQIPEPNPRRPHGRSGRDRPSRADVPLQAPWRQPVRHFAPVDLATEEQIEAIHQTALQILAEIGIDFLDEDARHRLAEAGAQVDPDSERVRFDREFIEEMIS
ncbi:MAG: trimethylamine methyltransferase family protein, partial [Acidimicrobiia bacterium]|nr:trimethylamine methyltransferase family protein [Acidimicrobiia bacterium]